MFGTGIVAWGRGVAGWFGQHPNILNVLIFFCFALILGGFALFVWWDGRDRQPRK